MPTNLTDALLSSHQLGSVLRTGIVTDWNPTTVQVMVGGTEIQAAFLDWYQPPIVGDLVAVIRQDSTWLVLGRYAGAGANLVENPSFEYAAPSTGVPLNWGTFTLMTGAAPLGTTVVSTVADDNSPDEGQVVNMTIGALTAQDVILTSSPIFVNPGDNMFLSAYVSAFGFTPGSVTTPPHHAQLLACWFSDETETFPSATQTDDYTMVQRILNVRESPPYSFMSGAVQVPAGVPAGGVMRVGLRVEFQATAIYSVRWDYVTARRNEVA